MSRILHESYDWTPWHPNNHEPFAGDAFKGIGPGEFKLVAEPNKPWTGGAIQGSGKNFDILSKEGRKFEVKATDTGIFRLSGESIRIVTIYIDRFMDFAKQAKECTNELAKGDSQYLCASLDELDRKIDVLIQNLKVQNLPKGMVLGTKQKEGEVNEIAKCLASFARQYSRYDAVQIQALGSKVWLPLHDLVLLTRKFSSESFIEIPIDRCWMAAQFLEHAYFISPESIQDEWFGLCDPGDAFPSDIDGLIVTNLEEGYFYIPRAKISRKIRLRTISFGDVSFEVIRKTKER